MSFHCLLDEASMTPKSHVAHVFSSLSPGGSVKGVLPIAREQTTWARVTAITRSEDAGPRADEFRAAGIAVRCGFNATEDTAKWIDETGCNVLIVHRVGRPNPVDNQNLELFRRHGVACFEYNIFGHYDPTTIDGEWTGHCHLSRASLLSYSKRAGRAPLAMHHLAAGYGIESEPLITKEERLVARNALGLPADGFVVARLLQPSLRKWDPMPVLAIKKLARRGVDVHYVVREVPPENLAWVQRQLGDRAKLMPLTTDADEYRQTLAAADVISNHSSIGETFGVALAEGMMVGLPIVTNSQPNLDNAQVEHCQHLRTGLLANTIGSLADRLESLARAPEKCVEYGRQGRKYIEDCFSPAAVEQRVRKYLIEQMRANNHPSAEFVPAPPETDDPYELTDAWIKEFRKAEQLPFLNDGTDSLADKFSLELRRMQNRFSYVNQVGWGTAAKVMANRLRKGRLGRT